MQRLVEDLLVLSALESHDHPLREEAVDVRSLLAQVHADAVALSAGKHDITLDIEADCIILGAETELKSAFGNLVSNAVRYTPPRGTVKLRWECSNGRGVFSVADSGIGIDAQHIPRLTERFYRVDRSRSRATGGTGLGLAIVKHVLNRHQATLAVESEPGRGSTFSAHFPPSRVSLAQRPVQLAASR